jgi:hypothetical protein
MDALTAGLLSGAGENTFVSSDYHQSFLMIPGTAWNGKKFAAVGAGGRTAYRAMEN